MCVCVLKWFGIQLTVTFSSLTLSLSLSLFGLDLIDPISVGMILVLSFFFVVGWFEIYW